MAGDECSLTVYENINNKQSEDAVLRVSGSQGNQWTKFEMESNITGDTIQFIFAGTRGARHTKNIAIDDISIIKSKCPVSTPAAITTTYTTAATSASLTITNIPTTTSSTTTATTTTPTMATSATSTTTNNSTTPTASSSTTTTSIISIPIFSTNIFNARSIAENTTSQFTTISSVAFTSSLINGSISNPCTENQYRCQTTGDCIEKELLCNGIKNCLENDDEDICPVWSDWIRNESCSVTCGGGLIKEYRECINGPGCDGTKIREVSCNKRSCPVWSDWKKGGDCSVSCGGGTFRQTRICLFGPGCSGLKDQNIPCNLHQCPEQSSCRFNIQATDTFQTITSPRYPKNYLDNLACNWTIKATSGRQILLVIHDFDTETCCDYLEIYDGSNFVERFKGRITHNLTFVSLSAMVKIRFHSDVNGNKKGFRATYKQTTNCGANLVSGKTGLQLSTSNVLKNDSSEVDCFWTLQTSNGTPLQLNISNGQTQDSRDYIVVYDGWKSIGRLQGRINTPQVFRTNSVKLRIHFHTKTFVPSREFQATFKEDGYFSIGAKQNCTLLDVGLIIDSSSSIGRDNFEIVRNFLRRFVSRLKVGLNDTRISALQFDSEVHPLWLFNESSNGNELIHRINNIEYIRTGTNTGNALRHVASHTSTLAEGDRLNVPDLAIVLTDGHALDDPEDAAQALRQRGIQVVAIAVGNRINIEQINKLASHPATSNVYFIDDFQELLGLVENVTTIACAQPTLTSWNMWGRCSHSCGSGVQIRTRSCQNGVFGDVGCQKLSSEQRPCPNLSKCPKWLHWTTWTVCSTSCGGGYTKRARICIDDNPEEVLCDGDSETMKSCRVAACNRPING